jgi:hypothetical protein
MTFLSLKKWNGQFESESVIRQIRRTILGRIAGGECVVVLDDGAGGLTDAVRKQIEEGWPPTKVLFSSTHPVLGGPLPEGKNRRK